ncbi:Glycosyltransferase involved in cell wall biogenesis [Olavius algarvensis associated proteobacterium Delta 3]|nr:Glycosyltransferase involved in cell wall biogenesis [Olavius algarvensis associated proteobacterium Delta 3]CAB5139719.1 Glycosyltransferase involved in cell wall biogenesis [Olavius algarvensis associated proteobacterium Delta 3]
MEISITFPTFANHTVIMEQPTVSIIIPAYNEAQNIGAIVSRIRNRYPDYEVIVIDDGSTDGTGQIASSAGATVYPHPYNIGNGAAIKTGIKNAGGDILVLMDGDGQHDPEDIAALLRFLPKYDMAVGARSIKDQASLHRALGNMVYNRFASYVAKFPIEDLTSGFRAVKASVARQFIHLLPNTYSYPTTMTLGVLRSGLSVKYKRIKIHKRHQGHSKVSIVRDGVRFFMIITRICTLFSPLRVFLPVSLLMFILGFVRYIHSFWTQGRFTNMSALLFVTCVVIFMMGLISEQITQMRYERRAWPRNVKKLTSEAYRQPDARDR